MRVGGSKLAKYALVVVVLVMLTSPTAEGQFLNAIRDLFKPLRNLFRPIGNGGGRGLFSGLFPRFRDGGTPVPQATGRDVAFPKDCGRDPIKGTGKLCFPDGKLCAQRNRAGTQRFGNHLYWMSWLSDDPRLRNTKWDWFNARNYCRKRCMDLVSFETPDEYEFVKSFIGNTKFFWTSGRLCNFDGCDRPEFFPKNINGWFWSANQARLSPTNSQSQFHDWSLTGGFQPPRPQPDNREKIQQGGAEEACLAVMNNFYGDGIKWHDVACHHEKPIVCEDVEGNLNFARQNFPGIRIP